jgi:hypothetical protein
MFWRRSLLAAVCKKKHKSALYKLYTIIDNGLKEIWQKLQGIVLGTIIISLAGCALTPPDFDEQQWRDNVQITDPSDLYAEHHKDGVYVNPWLSNDKETLSDVLL